MSVSTPTLFEDKESKGAFFSAWVLLHAIADSFPEHPDLEDKEHIRSFFSSLSYLLPCDTCNQGLRHELKAMPLDCSSGPALSKYVFDLHNQVNKKLGKPMLKWEDAMKLQAFIRRIDFAAIVQALLASAKTIPAPVVEP